jgi:HlyD family secretion protein
VFVADAGQARLRLIRSGRRPNGMVEVVSGLDAGEKVVAPIPADLQDGQPLEVHP